MKRMIWNWAAGAMLAVSVSLQAQTPAARPSFETFEVATVKPIGDHPVEGRYFRMEGRHRWIAVNFTLGNLIALAYDLNPKTISGGPGWMDSDKFNVEALTPGDVEPTHMEQMRMLRALLVERFALKFHRTDKEFSIYELTVAKGGPKNLKDAAPDETPYLVGIVSSGKIEVPAKNVSMDDFVAMLQRATLDRPTLNKTGLTGHYDFTLDWAPDETQYSGELGKAAEDAPLPPLFVAIQDQIGLKLTATHGLVSTMVVDSVEKPKA